MLFSPRLLSSFYEKGNFGSRQWFCDLFCFYYLMKAKDGIHENNEPDGLIIIKPTDLCERLLLIFFSQLVFYFVSVLSMKTRKRKPDKRMELMKRYLWNQEKKKMKENPETSFIIISATFFLFLVFAIRFFFFQNINSFPFVFFLKEKVSF